MCQKSGGQFPTVCETQAASTSMYKLQVVLIQPQNQLKANGYSIDGDNSDDQTITTIRNGGHIIRDHTRKFLHFTKPENTLLQLADEIENRITKLYSNLNIESFEILSLQDINHCDLDATYLVKDVFSMDNTVLVILKNELEFIDANGTLNANDLHDAGRISAYSSVRKRRSSKVFGNSSRIEPQILVPKRSKPNNLAPLSNNLRVTSPLANEISNDEINSSTVVINRNVSTAFAANRSTLTDRSFLPPPAQPQSPAIRISSGIGDGKRIFSESQNLDVVSRSEVVDPDKSKQQLIVPDIPMEFISTPNRVNLSGQRVISESQPKSLVFSKKRINSPINNHIDVQLENDSNTARGKKLVGAERKILPNTRNSDSPTNRNDKRTSSLELKVHNKRVNSTNVPIIEDVLKRIDNFSDTEEGQIVHNPVRSTSLASRQYQVDYGTNTTDEKDSVRSIIGSDKEQTMCRSEESTKSLGTSLDPTTETEKIALGVINGPSSLPNSKKENKELAVKLHNTNLNDSPNATEINTKTPKKNTDKASSVSKTSPVKTSSSKVSSPKKTPTLSKKLQAIVDHEYPDESKKRKSPITKEVRNITDNKKSSNVRTPSKSLKVNNMELSLKSLISQQSTPNNLERSATKEKTDYDTMKDNLRETLSALKQIKSVASPTSAKSKTAAEKITEIKEKVLKTITNAEKPLTVKLANGNISAGKNEKVDNEQIAKGIPVKISKISSQPHVATTPRKENRAQPSTSALRKSPRISSQSNKTNTKSISATPNKSANEKPLSTSRDTIRSSQNGSSKETVSNDQSSSHNIQNSKSTKSAVVSSSQPVHNSNRLQQQDNSISEPSSAKKHGMASRYEKAGLIKKVKLLRKESDSDSDSSDSSNDDSNRSFRSSQLRLSQPKQKLVGNSQTESNGTDKGTSGRQGKKSEKQYLSKEFVDSDSDESDAGSSD